MTLHQVNADGAGPYFCDLDEGSNSGMINKNLSVTNNVPGSNGLSQAQFEEFNITVTMPDDLKCIGGEFSRYSTPLSCALALISRSFNWERVYCPLPQQRTRWSLRGYATISNCPLIAVARSWG